MQKYDATKDYYDVLGVERDATAAEIDKAYRQQARHLHPDSGGSEEDMKALNEAHDLLSDLETREAYDNERRPPPIAFGSSYALNMEAIDTATTAGAFEVPEDDDGIAGPLISAATCLGLGIPFLILVESQWFFFLWPLRIMAWCMVGFGIWMANSTLSAYHRKLEKAGGKPARGMMLLQRTGFWLLVLALLAMLVAGLYVR